MKDFVRFFVVAKALLCPFVVVLMFLLLPAMASEDTWQVLITKGDRNINEQKLIEADRCNEFCYTVTLFTVCGILAV